MGTKELAHQFNRGDVVRLKRSNRYYRVRSIAYCLQIPFSDPNADPWDRYEEVYVKLVNPSGQPTCWKASQLELMQRIES